MNNQDSNYDIAGRLKMLMKINNYTISELADKADISEDTIKSIRSGKTKNPSIHILTAIANVFSCTIDNLIGRFPSEQGEAELLRKWRSLDSHGRNQTKMVMDNELSMQPAITGKTRLFMYYTPVEYTNNGSVVDLSRPEYIDIPHNYMPDAEMGFKIVSDSYIPSFFPGDIIAIKKRQPVSGEPALYYKDSIAYIRKPIIINSTLRLQPIHAAHNETELKDAENHTCMGTIIGIMRTAM